MAKPVVIQAKPPIYDEIVARIGTPPETAVFTYGEAIYSPSTTDLSDDLIEHEKKHIEQQREIGPDQWWRRYFDDLDFRREQELAAYRAQYRAVTASYKDRNVRARALFGMAGSFAGAMYGRIITFGDAQRLIKPGAESAITAAPTRDGHPNEARHSSEQFPVSPRPTGTPYIPEATVSIGRMEKQ